MMQLRCKYCSRLLMKIQWGRGECKCGRCGKIIKFDVTTQKLQMFMDKLDQRQQQVTTS